MERQLRIQRADLLAVAECCDRDRAICVAELRRFQQCQCRNALASSKLKGVRDQCIDLVLADFHLVSVTVTVVHKLGFHAGFSDQSI